MSKASLQWLAIGLHPLQSAAAALRLHQGPKKEIHEGHAGEKSYPRRGWRRLERGLPRIAKRRKNFHEKAKRYPRRATKNGEGPLRGWRRPERNPPKVATKGERLEISTETQAKRQKDFHEGQKDHEEPPGAKGLEKTRKGSVRGHEERHSGGKPIWICLGARASRPHPVPDDASAPDSGPGSKPGTSFTP